MPPSGPGRLSVRYHDCPVGVPSAHVLTVLEEVQASVVSHLLEEQGQNLTVLLLHGTFSSLFRSTVHHRRPGLRRHHTTFLGSEDKDESGLVSTRSVDGTRTRSCRYFTLLLDEHHE